ncbi:polysaccharide biosynthesis/export family protein [Formosa algae]|uniref:Polysaccharide export outer membrane protein n=1 Tax=Formosa algae TaxID=225843 RepID=A0A9X1CD24_9FLAO|nr:polysaccharide biosynthesis/export family protein [Formosa algae]MBP1841712.1 polysaccharide export outer membrane protein [Formosa algae]MDQ0337190.1 polysaccharide export outer membrane protein [Formosa algae]OEI79880.1 sugar transporter [Formosa algae]PNW26358.1 sugar transporter [Formosa algae]
MTPIINQFQLKFLLIPIMALMLASCGAKRESIVYFQDEQATIQTELSEFEIRFKPDDLLTIDVSAIDPEAARPFNLPAVSYNTNSVDLAQGTLKMQTYLIDREGMIEFPVLGSIKLGGLTRSEANLYMKNILKEYIKDPIVNIRLANFSITILGEVNRPGTYNLQEEKVSLTEALGYAGDLTIYGRRDNVFLTREIDGKLRYYKFDLTSIHVMNSPHFYLTQNDVIYVEPNKAKIRSSNYNQNNVVLISAIATLATITALILN